MRISRIETYLVLLQAVLEDVLDDQTTSLTKGDLVPHPTKCLVDILHDLWRRLGPAKLEKLLPDVASIAVNDGLWNAAKQLVNHDGLVVLWNGIKGLLNNVASKSIHGQVESVATDGLSDLDDLLRSSVLEAPLNEKVTEAVDHQWISLGNNGLNNVILLLSGTDLELLLKEDRSLLIIVADNLVDDVLPVAVDSAVQQAAVVEWLRGWKERLTLDSNGLTTG